MPQIEFHSELSSGSPLGIIIFDGYRTLDGKNFYHDDGSAKIATPPSGIFSAVGDGNSELAVKPSPLILLVRSLQTPEAPAPAPALLAARTVSALVLVAARKASVSVVARFREDRILSTSPTPICSLIMAISKGLEMQAGEMEK